MRRLRDETGITLVLALGFLVILSVVGTTLATYTAQNATATQRGRKTVEVAVAAEGGTNRALSLLYSSFQPNTASALPGPSSTSPQAGPKVETIGGVTVTWYGVLSGTTWTITSKGSMPNPAAPGSTIQRTITRLVTVQGLSAGANTSAWSRIYEDAPFGCLTLPAASIIYGPLATKGDLCLNSASAGQEAKILGSATDVWVAGNITLQSGGAGASIGTSGSPIRNLYVGGTCKIGSSSAHSPCSSADNTYAGAYGGAPTGLIKPGVDFNYWYNNAKPGPKYPCTTTSGSPPAFDNDTTYNGTQVEKELTPELASYTCQRWESGVKVGEISWDRTTRIFTIQGTVFFDGAASFHDHDTYVREFGRGTIYIAGNWHNDEVICAGGLAPPTWSYLGTSCRNNMSSWDPTQNLLVLIIGDKNLSGANDFDFHRGAAFQGVIWSKNKCTLKESAYMSGPLICNDIDFSAGTGVQPILYDWPPLGSPLPGQIYAGTSTSTDFMLANSTQSE